MSAPSISDHHPDRRAEAWLRGPVAGVPPLLQPVAHALVQVADEARAAARDLPDALLWARPAGAASVGFHLRHVAGVVDRLLTYARDESLSAAQLDALAAEAVPGEPPEGAASLVARLDDAVSRALAQLGATPEASLAESRRVGRAGLPSTVIGLLVHAAEHSTRHLGQLLVTARVARAGDAGR